MSWSKKPKIFISLPMRGYTDDDIIERRNRLYSYVSDIFDLLDTLWMDEPAPSGNSVWYLGKSISALGNADLVLFADDWIKAPGCIIERMICNFYNIPYCEESIAKYYSEVKQILQ